MAKSTPNSEIGGGSSASGGGGRVRIVPARSNAMEEAQRISANHVQTNRAAERKSGALAKTTASRVNTHPYGKSEPIKIDSGKPTGTQAGHAVTSGKNTTKPVK